MAQKGEFNAFVVRVRSFCRSNLPHFLTVYRSTQFRNWLPGRPYAHIPGEVAMECELDVEVALPIVYPQNVSIFQSDDPQWAYYENNHFRFGIFNDFLDAIDGSYCTYLASNETGNSPKYDPHYPVSQASDIVVVRSLISCFAWLGSPQIWLQ